MKDKLNFSITPKKVFYGLLVVTTLVVFGGGYVYTLFLGKVNQKVSAAEEKRADLVLKDKKSTLLEKTEESESPFSLIEAELNEILPDTKAQSEAVSELIAIARTNGIELNTITFPSSSTSPGALSQATPSKITGIYSLPISVGSSTEVDYQLVKQFLLDVQSARRHFDVIGMNFSASPPTAEDPLGGRVTFTADLEAHFRATPPEPVKPAANAKPGATN